MEEEESLGLATTSLLLASWSAFSTSAAFFFAFLIRDPVCA